MTAEAPMRGNRRGLRRWWWLTPLVVPVAALVLANLWLALPPGRNWVAAKIQRRTGLEARVGAASVWPWSALRLRDVVLLQPAALRPAVTEPFARIAAIRIAPVWRSWLRGRRVFRVVQLDSPRLVVPVELLAELAKSQAPARPAAPPVAATTPPAAPPAAAVPAVPATPEAPPKPPAIALPPTAWLRLKNASFVLCSAASGKRWLEISGVCGSIPVAGSAATSTLVVGSVRAADEEILAGLNAALDWASPLLSLQPLETEIHGLKLTLAGKLGMLGGLPLQLDAQLPRQPLAVVSWPADGHAAAQAIAANARFRGLLLAPGTWQGDFVTETLAPSGSIAGHEAAFDRGSAVVVLRGGMLSCVDARLIGDQLSLLGNATLLADGRGAGALRMVAPPETAAAIAARVFPGLPQPLPLTPLSTPQRAAFDLEAFGDIRQPFLRLGREGPIIELKR